MECKILDIFLWVFIFYVLALAFACIVIPDHKYKPVFVAGMIGSMVLRFATVLYIYRWGCDTFGTDGLLYHKIGKQIAYQLSDGIPLAKIEYPYTFYSLFIGLIYYIFGINRYIASFFNVFLIFLSGLMLFRMALKRKLGFENASIITLIFLYFPNIVLWTADTRKESLMIFVCFLAWYLVQDISNNTFNGKFIRSLGYIIKVAAICLLIWIATMIRIYLFIPMVLGIVASQAINFLRNKQKASIFVALAVVASMVVIFFTTVYEGIESHHALSLPQSTNEEDFAKDVHQKMEAIEQIIFKKNLAREIINFIILPTPSNVDIDDIRGMDKAILSVQIDMLVWYFCIFLMLAGIYSAIKNVDSCSIGILIYILAYILINAMLVQSDPGTIYRYRAQIVGFSMLFVDFEGLKRILYGFFYVKQTRSIR